MPSPRTEPCSPRFEEIVILSELLETTRNCLKSAEASTRKLQQSNAKGSGVKKLYDKTSIMAQSLQLQLKASQQLQIELIGRLQAEAAQSASRKLGRWLGFWYACFATARMRRRALERGGKSYPGGTKLLARRLDMLEQPIFFDREWYLTHYPDVSESRAMREVHFLKYGAAEIRDPGPLFSTRRYVEMYPNIASSKVDPLIHYIEFGYQERRPMEPSRVE